MSENLKYFCTFGIFSINLTAHIPSLPASPPVCDLVEPPASFLVYFCVSHSQEKKMKIETAEKTRKAVIAFSIDFGELL